MPALEDAPSSEPHHMRLRDDEDTSASQTPMRARSAEAGAIMLASPGVYSGTDVTCRRSTQENGLRRIPGERGGRLRIRAPARRRIMGGRLGLDHGRSTSPPPAMGEEVQADPPGVKPARGSYARAHGSVGYP
jgi:hypothetical protein